MKNRVLVKMECKHCKGLGYVYDLVFEKKTERKYTDNQAKEAFDLYQDGTMLEDIAKSMGLPHKQTARNLVFRHIDNLNESGEIKNVSKSFLKK